MRVDTLPAVCPASQGALLLRTLPIGIPGTPAIKISKTISSQRALARRRADFGEL